MHSDWFARDVHDPVVVIVVITHNPDVPEVTKTETREEET